MKPLNKPSVRIVAFGFSFLFLMIGFTQNAFASNTIAGYIFDRARMPIADIDVVLQDEYYRFKQRMKTDSSGRYEFNGLNDGNYTVLVYAFRYDLEDQSQYVEVKSISSIPGQTGSSYNPVDFYLQPRKGGLRDAELSVIFAQEVPREAEKVYKKAIDDLANKRPDAGFTGLQQALTIFPEYYVALMRYGQELFTKQQYSASVQVFVKAAEVNPKSALPFYNAGYALSRMGDKYLKNAKIALDESLKLAPLSTAVLLQLGKVERRMGNATDAEKHLVLAKKQSNVKNPEVRYELAQLYENNLKKYKEAADELEQFLKASTNLSDQDQAKTKEHIADLRVKAKAQASTTN